MTLEIQMPNGDTETANARIDYKHDTKTAMLETQSALAHLNHIATLKQHGKKSFLFEAFDVVRQVTNHGIVYRGRVRDLTQNRVLTFFLF